MTSPSDKPNSLKAWWDRLTPEERSEHGRKARAVQKFKATPGSFKAGDPRAAEAGRKGGQARGACKRRNMAGTVQTRGDRYRGDSHDA